MVLSRYQYLYGSHHFCSQFKIPPSPAKLPWTGTDINVIFIWMETSTRILSPTKFLRQCSPGPVLEATLALPPLFSCSTLRTWFVVQSLQNVRKGPLLPTTCRIAGIRPHNKEYVCPWSKWGPGEASGAQDWLYDPSSPVYILPTCFPGERSRWSLYSILVLKDACCLIQDRTNIGKSYATLNEEDISLI